MRRLAWVVLCFCVGIPDASAAGPGRCRAREERVERHLAAGEVEAAWALAEALARRCEVAARAVVPADRPTAAVWAMASAGPGDPATAAVATAAARACREAGAPADALRWGERALALVLAQVGPDHPDAAIGLGDLALYAQEAGDLDRALALAERAVAERERILGADHVETAGAWANLAVLHLERGRPDLALPVAERAVERFDATAGPKDLRAAKARHTLGAIHRELGAYEAARPLLEEALRVEARQLDEDHPDVIATVQALAGLAADRGDAAEAERLSARAVALAERRYPPEHPHRATVASYRAVALAGGGDLAGALAWHERAVASWSAALGPDHPVTLIGQNNLGRALRDAGAAERSRAALEPALARATASLGADHPTTLALRHNLGLALSDLGDVAGAVEALAAAADGRGRVLGTDHPTTANSRHHLAAVWLDAGQPDEAAPHAAAAAAARVAALGEAHPDTARSVALRARIALAEGRRDEAEALVALALPTALASPSFEARVEGLAVAMDAAAAAGRLPEAALWGKLAVRVVQGARAGVGALDRGLEDGFVTRHEGLYRRLADALVRQGRLAEAEEVLALLKAEELSRFTRREAERVGEGPALSEAEAAAVARLDAGAALSVAEARELEALRAASASAPLPEATQARLAGLQARRLAHREAMDAVVSGLRVELAAAGRAEEVARLGLERTARLQRALRAAPAGTVLIHAILLPDAVLLLLTTPELQLAERVPVGSEAVSRAVLALRQALASPAADPRPPGQALYDALLRPLEGHLAQAEASTLLLSLDGPLRYAPVAALHDGERFVAERWATALFTPASAMDLLRAPAEAPEIAAFGTSRAAAVGEDRFSPLGAVPLELEAVVADGDGGGVVPGRAWLDEGFTRGALSEALLEGVPWVHIASHFRFKPGTEADSYLLLGGGDALTVRELRLGDFPLDAVDLLVLSACETAMGGARADGSEVEGLAAVAQNQGAGAVLATLWPVADESTAAWMAALYRALADGSPPHEALRAVQIAFLHGATETGAAAAQRGAVVIGADAAPPLGLEGWRHPYHWAPFVLYGTAR